MPHFYSCYGFTISSVVPLPGLPPVSPCAPDITISTGNCPKALERPSKIRPEFEVSDHQVLLRPTLSKPILIEHGHTITIEYDAESNYLNEIPYILGSAIGAALQQQQKLILHASAVTQKSGTGSILICGKSGQGKSTTVLELIERGYTYTSDDISALSVQKPTMHTPTIFVHPAYPQLRLWDDALAQYDFSPQKKQLVKTEGPAKKYALEYQTAFNQNASQVRALVFLSQQATPTTQIKRVYGKTVFAILRNNIYRKAFLSNKLLQRNISLIEEFANLVPTYQINRPENQNTVTEVGDLIEQLIKQFSNSFEHSKTA